MNFTARRTGSLYRLSLHDALPIFSGPSLSHWTELTGEAGRVVTLHLKGKTEGEQEFSVSLVGPGIKPVKGWVRSEEHTSELQSPCNLVCRRLLEKKNRLDH